MAPASLGNACTAAMLSKIGATLASLREVAAPSGAATGLREAGPHQRLWSVIPRGRPVLMNFSSQGNSGTVSLLSHFPIPFV